MPRTRPCVVLALSCTLPLLQVARKELLGLDFEGILNYFRVVLPRKFQSEEECQHLFHTMSTFKVSHPSFERQQCGSGDVRLGS